MQVPCHARAFCQSLIEANADGSRDLTQPQLMKSPQNGDSEHNAENSEPACLQPRRRHFEVKRVTGFIPGALVGARYPTKTVPSWAKGTKERLPPGTWCFPVCIATYQFVTKAYFLRDHKA